MTKTVFSILLALLALPVLPAPALHAQEEEGEEAALPGADAAQTLADLEAANKERNVDRIRALVGTIVQLGKTSKDQEALDPIARELAGSLKVIRDDVDLEGKILEALGELRSRYSETILKRYAFKKRTRDEEDVQLKVTALKAIGKLRDKRLIDKIEDECKAREMEVAEAAYEAFEHYGTLDGRTRKKVTDILMKRFEAEYPAAGGQGSGNVSQEARERWNKLSPVIVKSLQSVTHETTINDLDNWREWWKEAEDDRRYWRDDD